MSSVCPQLQEVAGHRTPLVSLDVLVAATVQAVEAALEEWSNLKQPSLRISLTGGTKPHQVTLHVPKHLHTLRASKHDKKNHHLRICPRTALSATHCPLEQVVIVAMQVSSLAVASLPLTLMGK